LLSDELRLLLAHLTERSSRRQAGDPECSPDLVGQDLVGDHAMFDEVDDDIRLVAGAESDVWHIDLGQVRCHPSKDGKDDGAGADQGDGGTAR
jgi:hypothetical protein